MPRSPRKTAAADAALIGSFILWAQAIQALDGVALVGPQHKAAIAAAAQRLYTEVRQASTRKTCPTCGQPVAQPQD